ncbi:MAG: hypothetical protein R6V06_04580 [Kiritimatiellia bacterium]
MVRYKHFYVMFTVVFCLNTLSVMAATVTNIVINGPTAVDEEGSAAYSCTAHYSDGTQADVTGFVDCNWSIPGAAETGVWFTDLNSAKAESDVSGIPMVYIWGSDSCDFCDDFEMYIAHSAFEDWMTGRQLVMAYVEASSTDESAEKEFAKTGQNGTLVDYPFVSVYWPSKSNEVWNFSGRYDGDDEELQLIAEIEHYISEYSSGPANCAFVDGGDFIATAVPSNTVVTLSVSWSGFTATKDVTILDIPVPRDIIGESFETGFGLWTNVSGSDFEWTRKSGYTLSEGTGPAEPLDGNYYIYTEASGNYPLKTAAIEGVVNVSAAVSPALLFDYHMYGADTGSLYVDVYDGSQWHTAIWSLSGQQDGSSSVSWWSEAQVDLSAFAGNITLRIRGVTDGGYLSDMAIDNIRFVDTSDISPISFSAWLDLESVPSGERGESDDPAGDGVANILKYACGIPAMQAVSSADLLDIVFGATPDVFSVRYYRDATATGVIIDPVMAETLAGPWQTSGVSKELIGADGDIQEWRGSISLGESGFIRLRATPAE